MLKGKAKIRLLLVDDEVGYLKVLSKRLKRRNIDVIAANTGQKAIQLFRRNDFDVAVVDLKMMDMDGIDVLDVLKKMDPYIEVIILTGHGSERAAREGIEKGAFDYLTKPCGLQNLVNTINAASSKRSEMEPNDST